VALVAFALALFIVVTGSDAPNDEGGSTRTEAGNTDRGERSGRRRSRRRSGRLPSDCYTVKAGDTLAGISDKVGIPVERLQEQNTDLDPQALVSGQSIALKDGADCG
jgi:hypothetical protein